MVFENEINIYAPDAILNEFRSQATQLSVTQGKISAIISDSQIQELRNGEINMFDRLVSTELTIGGIRTQVSELTQRGDEFESSISTLTQTASSISAEVSSVKNDYARKSQIILAINNVTQESEILIDADHISLAGKKINLTSDNIEIRSDNFTVDKYGNMTAKSGTFSGRLSAATGTFAGSLSAATGTFAGSLSAATGTFKGSLSAATGTFAGDLSAAGGTFSGRLSAASGTFYGSITSADGNQRLYINEALLRGYEGSTLFGLLDLCAQYDSGGKHVALRSEGTLHLQANSIQFENRSGTIIGFSGTLPVGSGYDYEIVITNGIITGWR